MKTLLDKGKVAVQGFIAFAVALVAVLFAPMKMAHADIDVSALVTKIEGQVTNIETIGMAILAVLVVILALKLLKTMLR